MKNIIDYYTQHNIGGIQEIEEQVVRLHEKGPKRIKPLTLPKALPNMGAGNVNRIRRAAENI